MKTKSLLQILVFIGLYVFSYPNAYAQKPVDKCATMEMDSLLRQKFPKLGTLRQLEYAIQGKVNELENRYRSGRVTADVITIPVVVHIIHNGEAVGQGRNISEAQVKAQLEVLNEDFRRKSGTRGFNSDARGADIEIEFCLAELNLQNQKMTEKGIDRVRGSRTAFTRSQIEGEVKPNTIWDPGKYYNIWVLDFTGEDNNLLGYAQFPSQSTLPGISASAGAANTDGVVIRYTSFGCAEKGTFPVLQAPYNLGRTLTHETGHWLGLRHIWGDGNCADDFVSDTPTQQSESRGCAKGRVSCGSVNMVENYMDYSDDACMNIFTNGQKLRIRAVMEISTRRRELLASNVCGTPIVAKPIPNFVADKQSILRGSRVIFTDLSANSPTQWQWTFPGGEPATSTDKNPVVTYSTSGTYAVSLVATNSIGASDPLVRTAYIEVSTAGICGINSNFSGTPTVLRETTPTTGYIAGHNSRRDQAKAEYFNNSLGYANVSGTTIRFGQAYAAGGAASESTITILVWNARGFQGSPGQVLERKEIPIRTILQDVAQNQPTEITFDRNVPVDGYPYYIGLQLNYANRDSVALITNRNGEASQVTAWEQNSQGTWQSYSIARGINVSHAITANVGMNESVQLGASTLFVDAGQPVTLSARGSSLYSWAPATNLSAILGPQVIAYPTQTTTYTVTGSGLDLCSSRASVTVFVRNPTAAEPNLIEQALIVSPNPTEANIQLSLVNELKGKVGITVYNSVGRHILSLDDEKSTDSFSKVVNMNNLAAGIYIIEFRLKGWTVRRKVVKW